MSFPDEAGSCFSSSMFNCSENAIVYRGRDINHRRRVQVFSWSEIGKWERAVRAMLADVIDARLVRRFRKRSPEFIVGDDLSWLDDLIGWNESIHDVFTDRFIDHYDSVLAFHGCRPTRLAGYRRAGLRLCNIEKLNTLARRIFGCGDEIDNAIADLAHDRFGYSYSELNSARIFFCLSKQFLVEHCGHYLLYGSEYLLCIGARLGRKQELRNRGKATVVEVALPISILQRRDVRELCGRIIEEIFERVLDPQFRTLAPNFGFEVRHPVPPECIVAFHHPTRIPNPHNYMLPEN